MKTTKTAGFTIIEVTLFLAISGLMAVMLLVGASLSIQRQQYRESVVGYQGFLKDQYSRVVNVENNRSTGKVCSDSASTARGQSDCVIVGRYVVSSDAQGRNYQVMPVYARPDASGESFTYRLDTSNPETYQMQWSVQSRQSTQATGDALVSVLMYRDPITSAIHIKMSPNRLTNGTIGDLVAQPPQTTNREICVFDTGWFKGARQSVFIDAKVSASEAFRVGQASEACNNA